MSWRHSARTVALGTVSRWSGGPVAASERTTGCGPKNLDAVVTRENRSSRRRPVLSNNCRFVISLPDSPTNQVESWVVAFEKYERFHRVNPETVPVTEETPQRGCLGRSVSRQPFRGSAGAVVSHITTKGLEPARQRRTASRPAIECDQRDEHAYDMVGDRVLMTRPEDSLESEATGGKFYMTDDHRVLCRKLACPGSGTSYGLPVAFGPRVVRVRSHATSSSR